MNAKPSLVQAAENTAEKQPRGRPFEPGQSGNPQGRPKGSRNKATLWAEAVLDDESETVVGKFIEKAKEGDPTALRLYIDRLRPKRDRPVQFELPAIKTLEDITNASEAVLNACAQGKLAPREAVKVMALISAHLANLNIRDMDERLREVERKSKEL